MPLAFVAALAGSLLIHGLALFLPEVDLSLAPEPPPLIAEVQPPKPPPARREKVKKRQPKASAPAPHAAISSPPGVTPGEVVAPGNEAALSSEAEPLSQSAPTAAEPEDATLPESPVDIRLPARGRIRFLVYKGDQGLEIGRAEQSWEFEENRYRLISVTETAGLAALFKPIRVELESRGTVTPQGLRPERFATRRNGKETRENADFDWTSRQLTLERDGSRHELRDGTQDLLSFHYQFGYLASLEQGAEMAVATGRKFERYRFVKVGEETLQTPAGLFRVVHVRVQTDSTTELWLALDHLLLPVKIRHTDRKGESFEELATELGT